MKVVNYIYIYSSKDEPSLDSTFGVNSGQRELILLSQKDTCTAAESDLVAVVDEVVLDVQSLFRCRFKDGRYVI